MFGAIYTGLSGMITFSKGLDVISNNVANMNTPGFKGSELQFRDVFYECSSLGSETGSMNERQVGHGVKAAATAIRFHQGEIRETGNATDVAVDGNGYFVLRKDGKTVYTRAGQFEFDERNFLVSKTNQARVASLSGGTLGDINIAGHLSNPAKATTSISFSDNLSLGDAEHEIADLEVFDASGRAHSWRMVFTNNGSVTPRSWLIELFDEEGNSLTTGEIRFQGNGSPEEGFSAHSFEFHPAESDPVTVTLEFGDPGSFAGATSFSGGSSSTLRVEELDGHGVGSLTEAAFDEDGYLVLKYSNDEEVRGARLALAHFDHQQALMEIGDGLFRPQAGQDVSLLHAGEGPLGAVRGASIELSNVELAQQFTELVITQRGYQASSQVLSVANEMLQELYNARSRR